MALINSAHYLKPDEIQHSNNNMSNTTALELLHVSHTLPTPSHLALDNLSIPTFTAMTSKNAV